MVNDLGEIIAFKKVYLFRTIKKYYVYFIAPLWSFPLLVFHGLLMRCLVSLMVSMIILRGKFMMVMKIYQGGIYQVDIGMIVLGQVFSFYWSVF